MNAQLLCQNLVLAFFLFAAVSAVCRYDSDCGSKQVQCVNGLCVSTAKIECQRHRDCLKNHGKYSECNKQNECIKSKHKICLSDKDCSGNMVNRKCKQDRCSIPIG